MNSKQYLTLLPIMFQLKRPMLVLGKPGQGKTDIVMGWTKSVGIGACLIQCPLLNPEDTSIPVYDRDTKMVDWIMAARLPFIGHDGPEEGVVILDELAAAPENIQKMCASWVQDRELQGHKMKPGWSFVMTGNRVEDKTGSSKILGHLGNRITVVELTTEFDAWRTWAIQNGVSMNVIAFLSMATQLFNDYDPKRVTNPTPRSWVDGVSKLEGVIPSDLEYEVFAGAVGAGPAAEYIKTRDSMSDCPTVDEVLADPQGCRIPKDVGAMNLIVGSMVRRTNHDTFEKLFDYAVRFRQQEFIILYARTCLQTDVTLANNPTFTKWATGAGKDMFAAL